MEYNLYDITNHDIEENKQYNVGRGNGSQGNSSHSNYQAPGLNDRELSS